MLWVIFAPIGLNQVLYNTERYLWHSIYIVNQIKTSLCNSLHRYQTPHWARVQNGNRLKAHQRAFFMMYFHTECEYHAGKKIYFFGLRSHLPSNNNIDNKGWLTGSFSVCLCNNLKDSIWQSVAHQLGFCCCVFSDETQHLQKSFRLSEIVVIYEKFWTPLSWSIDLQQLLLITSSQSTNVLLYVGNGLPAMEATQGISLQLFGSEYLRHWFSSSRLQQIPCEKQVALLPTPHMQRVHSIISMTPVAKEISVCVLLPCVAKAEIIV